MCVCVRVTYMEYFIYHTTSLNIIRIIYVAEVVALLANDIWDSGSNPGHVIIEGRFHSNSFPHHI